MVGAYMRAVDTEISQPYLLNIINIFPFLD